jgi:tetratricopeptide (TPR) repeat protein
MARSSRLLSPAVAIVAAALAIPAVWAGAVVAGCGGRRDASDDPFAAGHHDEAATAARSAAAAEPWSAEPWLRLATVEQAAGNLEAAQLDLRRAIELTPADFRPWLLASGLEGNLGNDRVASAYGLRAGLLAPLIIQRAAIDPDLLLGSGS